MKETTRRRGAAGRRARRLPRDDGTVGSYALAPESGEGFFFTERLRPGLAIVYADYRIQPGAVNVREVEYGTDVVFRYRVTGRQTLTYRGFDEVYEFLPGDCAVMTTQRPLKGIAREESTGDRKMLVTIRMSRSYLLQHLRGRSDPLARAIFSPSRERDHGPIYFERRTLPPQASLALQQVIRCAYEGPTKQIFLESKCLELLAMFLASAPAEAVRAATPVKFSAKDIEAIKSARDVLLSNLIDPPALEELGAMVGMRPTKLKLGFKHVFGRTCFNYLRDRRLEFAKDLLAQGKLSIEEVGQAAGFPNASHFTQAFQKHYGVLPKAVRGQLL